jgi:hypothetical protein
VGVTTAAVRSLELVNGEGVLASVRYSHEAIGSSSPHNHVLKLDVLKMI